MKGEPNREAVRRMLRALVVVKQELDLEILRTPTGPWRDLLTEANIYLNEAETKMLECS
jgi:hypothetical protein